MVKYYLEADDDTYIYGDKVYECEYCSNTKKYLEPYIRREKNKLIKFYRDSQYIIIYENDVLTEIIKTMTCWSDDYVSYKIRDKVAYEYDKNYHGRPCKRNAPCEVDFSQFISDNNL
jgi:hypothetical protein